MALGSKCFLGLGLQTFSRFQNQPNRNAHTVHKKSESHAPHQNHKLLSKIANNPGPPTPHLMHSEPFFAFIFRRRAANTRLGTNKNLHHSALHAEPNSLHEPCSKRTGCNSNPDLEPEFLSLLTEAFSSCSTPKLSAPFSPKGLK